MLGQKIIVYTSHKHLVHDALCIGSDRVMVRGILLEKYEPKIVHKAGIKNSA